MALFSRPALVAALAVLLPSAALAQTTVSGSTFLDPSPNLAGDLTLAGGTIFGNASGAYANNIIGSGSGALDVAGLNMTWSGVISGNGGPISLIDSVAGVGSLALSGANTYSGVFIVNGLPLLGLWTNSALGTGAVSLTNTTLQALGGARTVANAIQLNGANTFDANGNTFTFSGTLFGNGSVTLAGTSGNAINLNGQSSYSGGTTVGNGLIVGLGASNALGTGAASLNANTLWVNTGGISLTNSFSVTGLNKIQLDGRSVLLSGPISGAGSLELDSLSAGGVLTYSGAGSWSGGTAITSNSTLRLGAADILPQSGTLTLFAGGTLDLNGYHQTVTQATLSNNGTIKTGAATLLVNGNFNGTGTFDIFPMPTAPNLQANGQATLTGQTLSVDAKAPSGTYKIVTSGLLTGTFAGVTLPAGYADALSYSGNNAYLQLFAPSLVQAGQTTNQRAVAAALDKQDGGASPDMYSALVAYNALPTAAAQSAVLDQLTPIAYSALDGLAFAGRDAQSVALGRRAAALQAGWASRGARVDRYAGGPASPYPGVLVADAGGGPVTAAPSPTETPWGVYGAVLDSIGRQGGEHGDAGFQPGYHYATIGGMMGADYRFSEKYAAGLTVGYGEGGANIDDGVGHVGASGFRYGAYGAAWDGPARGTLFVGGALDSFTTDRDIPFYGRRASATPSGSELNAELTGAYDLKGSAGVLSPFAGLSWDRLKVGSFSETGAGQLDLNVAEQTAQSLRGALGARVSRRFDMGDDNWFGVSPSLTAGWQHEFEDRSRAIDATFATGAGAFTTRTADVSRDALTAAAALSLDFGTDAVLRLGYAGDFRKDFLARSVEASLRVAF